MKPTQELHDLGQSLWLDNITRDLLDDGTLARYIRDDSVTGLTSNPSIFQKAMASGHAYDADIAAADAGTSTEALFAQMALADLGRAASLFQPAHQQSNGMDGWVSMEVSPLLADDAPATVQAAKALHAQGGRDNLFIKIPGTPAGCKAIEEAIFAGIPINVTLLFSAEQTLAAAQAWMRGLERRLDAGHGLNIHSVLSLFVSRWDVAVKDKAPEGLANQLGLAVAGRTWAAWQELQQGQRWQRLKAAGAPVQRMLWASTGTKDPHASDVLYIEALALAGTINTIPDQTLQAFADHGQVPHSGQAAVDDAHACEQVIARFEQAGVDVDALAEQLQQEGAQAFVKSWRALMQGIQGKRAS